MNFKTRFGSLLFCVVLAQAAAVSGATYDAYKGTYAGLFLPTNGLNGVALEDYGRNGNAGVFTLTLTDEGVATGRASLPGSTMPFSLRFTNYEAQIRIRMASTNIAPIDGWLVIDTNQAAILGSIIVDGVTSELRTFRVVPGTAEFPSAYAGRYTMLVRGGRHLVPLGDGFTSITVSDAGVVSCVGALPDGTPVSFSGPVSTNGLFPMYSGLYAGRGFLIGWVDFKPGAPAADAAWVKLPSVSPPRYPDGIHSVRQVQLSRYTPVDLTNAIPPVGTMVEVGGGGLAAPVRGVFTETESGVRLAWEGQPLGSYSMVSPNGIFSLSFIEPVTGLSRTAKGTVLQGTSPLCSCASFRPGAGHFVGAESDGYVWLTPPTDATNNPVVLQPGPAAGTVTWSGQPWLCYEMWSKDILTSGYTRRGAVVSTNHGEVVWHDSAPAAASRFYRVGSWR